MDILLEHRGSALIDFLALAEESNYKYYKKLRAQEIAGIIESSFSNRYYIIITVEINSNLITEYNQYRQFKRTNNLFYKHSADLNIPVQNHFHIIDRKSKKELYAVNFDGTAHHRENAGFLVPKKEAEELKKLGVNFKDSNYVLEYKNIENAQNLLYQFNFIFDVHNGIIIG